MQFTDSFNRIRETKSSNLCIGIDPAYGDMRDKMVVSPNKDPPTDILEFSLDIIERTGEHAACFKPNLQYILPLGLEGFKTLNKAIHDQDCLSLLDIKLSDIGSTNDASCYWIKRSGFDAITGSPFPGNMTELWASCKKKDLGLFLLCLMSNPEAKTFMKSMVGNSIAYELIAKVIEQEGITGAVVGATVPSKDLDILAGTLRNSLVLVPGIGAQEGSLAILDIFGRRSIVNVSRDIIFSKDPVARARDYKDRINQILP
ncbi:MAG TPA: orotidine-5'-phosphate decarboxylase [Candidatus Methanofastidiosa archaeon]|nr:orotidine-5'-phosphate decarboxylase [Candidatus Methanofastidiosa archaeon]